MRKAGLPGKGITLSVATKRSDLGSSGIE
jgi:hypothetical protein